MVADSKAKVGSGGLERERTDSTEIRGVGHRIPKVGTASLPNAGAVSRNGRSPCLMPTLGLPQHSCPTAHLGTALQTPELSFQRPVSDRPAALRPLHHKLLLPEQLFGKPLFRFQPISMAVIVD